MFPLALATIAFAFYSDIAMTALQSRIVLRGARVVQRGVPVSEGPRTGARFVGRQCADSCSGWLFTS